MYHPLGDCHLRRSNRAEILSENDSLKRIRRHGVHEYMSVSVGVWKKEEEGKKLSDSNEQSRARFIQSENKWAECVCRLCSSIQTKKAVVSYVFNQIAESRRVEPNWVESTPQCTALCCVNLCNFRFKFNKNCVLREWRHTGNNGYDVYNAAQVPAITLTTSTNRNTIMENS